MGNGTRDTLEASADGAISSRRAWWLWLVLALPLALLPLLPPIVQDPHYHAFVDTRDVFGIPNFLDVVSNAAFLAVGIAGIRLCLGHKISGATSSWLTFFVGVMLVAFGSTWYHWDPRDTTLVWDRLPMTIAFMGLFTALVTEHAAVSRQRTLLAVSIAVGASSVAWWRLTGDLKLYAWVQLAPFLAIALLLATYPAPYTGRRWLVLGFAFYALAKLAEFSDIRIYDATAHAISGHTLKHLLAAQAPLCVYLMLKKRTRTG
jgi:hypothetical protein